VVDHIREEEGDTRVNNEVL